ncbi:MAG: hypothetical protein ACYCZA_05635 [Thiobacillus sp.]
MSERVLPLSIPLNHPAYAGHFPGQPILPGVVLLDAALDALAGVQGISAASGQIKSAKFLSPVRPGDPLALHYTVSPPHASALISAAKPVWWRTVRSSLRRPRPNERPATAVGTGIRTIS